MGVGSTAPPQPIQLTLFYYSQKGKLPEYISPMSQSMDFCLTHGI